MRNAWAYMLILLYLSVVLRPWVPSLSYYSQQDYFASELCRYKAQPRNCCKGSCQFSRMAKEATQGDPVNVNQRILTEELPLVVLPGNAIDWATSQARIAFPRGIDLSLCLGNDREIWHPPTMQS